MGLGPFRLLSSLKNQGMTCFSLRPTKETPLLCFYSRTAYSVRLLFKSRDEKRRADIPGAALRLSCLWDLSASSAFCFPLWTPPFTQSQVLNLIPKANNFSKGTATRRSFGCDTLSVTILLKTGKKKKKCPLFRTSLSVVRFLFCLCSVERRIPGTDQLNKYTP